MLIKSRFPELKEEDMPLPHKKKKKNQELGRTSFSRSHDQLIRPVCRLTIIVWHKNPLTSEAVNPEKQKRDIKKNNNKKTCLKIVK